MSTSVSKEERPTFLTIRQAAWLLGVPRSAIWRAIRLGTLRSARVRSRVVVYTRDVVRLLGSAGGER
jgi:excisionase family DNA binding protein